MHDIPKHTNRLIHETSPYLLQHAHNPVDWYPWGEEALEHAKCEQKPILLSIGYSACHWCHVMERESFENEEIAAVMNELFINIKVDREERPDLDEIYMNAVQVMTRQGGWPMTVFLTPDLKPFYGGTYYPPTDRYGRPGFPKVMEAVAEAFTDKHTQVLEQADQFTAQLNQNKQCCLIRTSMNSANSSCRTLSSTTAPNSIRTMADSAMPPNFHPAWDCLSCFAIGTTVATPTL